MTTETPTFHFFPELHLLEEACRSSNLNKVLHRDRLAFISIGALCVWREHEGDADAQRRKTSFPAGGESR